MGANECKVLSGERAKVQEKLDKTGNPSIVRLQCSTYCLSPSIAEGLIQYSSVPIDAIMIVVMVVL